MNEQDLLNRITRIETLVKKQGNALKVATSALKAIDELDNPDQAREIARLALVSIMMDYDMFKDKEQS